VFTFHWPFVLLYYFRRAILFGCIVEMLRLVLLWWCDCVEHVRLIMIIVLDVVCGVWFFKVFHFGVRWLHSLLNRCALHMYHHCLMLFVGKPSILNLHCMVTLNTLYFTVI
jgi:hypothetical protein